MQRTLTLLTPHMGSLLADQQDKQSGSYQQGKQNTGDERNNRMPTRLDLFRSRAFLRRSDAQPEEKFVHRQDLATRKPLHMGSVSVLGKPNDDPHKTSPTDATNVGGVAAAGWPRQVTIRYRGDTNHSVVVALLLLEVE